MENNKKLLSANSFLFFKLIELLCEIEVEIINRNNVINLINSSTSDEYLIALLNGIMIERSIRSEKTIRPKTLTYWTDVFPNLNDYSLYNSFKSHFRMTRSTFNFLLSRISQHEVYHRSEQTPIEIQVAIVFWKFANASGYRQLEQTLGRFFFC